MERHTADDEKRKPERPMDPKTGALVMLGSLAVTAAATWALSHLFPLDPGTLEKFRLNVTSDGAWMVLGAWGLFPLVFAAAFVMLAKGVDPKRVVYAYAGGTYFLQCYAELTARNSLALWPELLFTAAPTIVLYGIMSRYAPGEDDPESTS